MTVGELLGKISSYEITEWVAYYILEQEDEEAADRKAKMKAKMG